MKFIFWYQEIDFLISRNVFWGAVLLFFKYFLISRNWFLDIKNSFMMARNIILDIKKWNAIRFLGRQNKLNDIYQEIDYLISRNVFWGAVLLFIKYFLISRNIIIDIKKWNLFLDIKKSNSWYQEIDFLISRNRILDIKKYLINSKTAPQTNGLQLSIPLGIGEWPTRFIVQSSMPLLFEAWGRGGGAKWYND